MGKIKNESKRIYRYKMISLGIGAIILMLIILLNVNIKNKESQIAKEVNVAVLNEENFIVCIDAGHGDWDIGAEGISGIYEKDINLEVTLKLGELLEEYDGIDIVYTRTNDELSWSDSATENLYDRVEIAKEASADMFISIHCNSSNESKTYRGVESWYNPDREDGRVLADLIQNELSELEYTLDRGVKTYREGDELAVLEHNSAVSVLIELGFISNLNDEKYLSSELGQSQCAEAIYNAIVEYKEVSGL